MAEKTKGAMNTKLIMLVACGALGLLLLLYGGGYFTGEEENVKSYTGDSAALIEYTKAVEESIRDLCSGVSGVSNVSVAVTLENGFEYVYAADSEVRNGESEYTYITVGSGSREGTVYITEKPPKIGGVGVVCRGGDDPAVQRKLISLISAAYNVPSNKIYIIGS